MASLLGWAKKRWETSVVRDLFDANTAADQQRRKAAGQPQWYQDQQAQQQQQPQQQGPTYNPGPNPQQIIQQQQANDAQVQHQIAKNESANELLKTIETIQRVNASAVTKQNKIAQKKKDDEQAKKNLPEFKADRGFRKPSQSQFDKAKDVLTANSPMDKYKRATELTSAIIKENKFTDPRYTPLVAEYVSKHPELLTDKRSVQDQVVQLAEGMANPFIRTANAIGHVPQTVYREIQNKPIDDIQRRIYGTNDSGTIAKNIIGDTATIGLTLGAPAIGKAGSTLAGSVLPNATARGILPALDLAGQTVDPAVSRLLTASATSTPISANLPTSLVANALANETINTGFGVSGQVASGEKIDIKKAAKEAIPYTAIGVGSELLPHAVNKVKNAKVMKLNNSGHLGDINGENLFSMDEYKKRAKAPTNEPKPIDPLLDINSEKSNPAVTKQLTDLGVSKKVAEKIVKENPNSVIGLNLLQNDRLKNVENPDAYAITAMKRNQGPTLAETQARLDKPSAPVESKVDLPVVNGKRISPITGEPVIDLPKMPNTDKPKVNGPPDVGTVKNKQGQTVNKSTGEVVKQPTLYDQVKKLPESKDATPEHLPDVGKTLDNLKAGFEAWGKQFTAKERKTYAMEVAQRARDGTPLSPRTQEMYKVIKPTIDALRDKSKVLKESGQFYDAYMREQVAGTGELVPFAETWIDSSNKAFTSSLKRKGAIALDQLDDPVNAYKNSTEQIFHDNYGHLKAAEKLKEKGYTQPVEYLKGREQISEDLTKAIKKEKIQALKNGRTEAVSSKHVESDLVNSLQKNFEKNGNSKEIVHSSSELATGATIRTERKIWQRVPDGKSNVYERSGMGSYDRAKGQGAGTFIDAGGKKILVKGKANITEAEFKKNVRDVYDGVYERDYSHVMDKTSFDRYVDNASTESYRGNYSQPLENLERSLAGEKTVHYAERNVFTSKSTAKAFNNEISYILKDGRRAKSLGNSVTNFLTGMFHSGFLGLNPRSAIQQISEFARVYGVGGNKVAKAAVESVKQMKPGQIKAYLHEWGLGDSYTKQMLHTTEGNSTKFKRRGNIVKRGYNATQEFTMKGFNAVESGKDVALLKTLEQKHAGIKDPYLRRTTILNEFNDTAIKGGHYGAIHATNQSNIARLGLQFGQYSMKDWGLMGERAKAGDKGYVIRTLGGKAVTAIPMYALFGSSIAYTLGLNEFKGGPSVSLATETFAQINNENKRIENEKDKGRVVEFDWDNVRNEVAKQFAPATVPGGGYLVNKIGVQDLYTGTKDVPFLRHDTTVNNLKKGYNSNKDGRARFTTPTDTYGKFKMLLGGAYNTDQAREYFGSKATDVKFLGINNTKGQQFNPVGQRYQDKINNAKKEDIGGLIKQGREKASIDKEFYDTPQGKAFKDLNSSTWNEDTQKYESDIITPEKWKNVSADKTGTTFKHNKEAAIKRHKDFGDPIDPIFKDKWKGHAKEIMDMRMQNTGDDTEMKDIAYATKKWYKGFSDDYIKYIKESLKRPFNNDTDYGPSPRVKKYWKLTAQNPSIPENSQKDYPLINKYLKVKEKDPDAGKQFFKDHVDQLTADFDKQKKQKWNWTNKMRELEGAKPLDWATFQNVTFGYEDDERKVAQDLYWKLKDSGSGSGYKKYGKKGSKGDGFKKGYLSPYTATSLLKTDKNPRNISVRNLTLAKNGGRTKKYTVKQLPSNYLSKRLG